MPPPSPSPIPVPAAVATGDFPYKWDEIARKLGLDSKEKISDFILAPIFFQHWVKLRDQMPLRPGTSVEIIPAEGRAAIVEFTITIYTAMDCMATSKYDRPTPADHVNWTTIEYIECLVYQCARDLAAAGRPLHVVFERQKLKNEAGRKDALSRIRGLAMLVCNLIVNYTRKQPSMVIRKIEAKRPAKDPSLSPLPEVRRKWQLENMDLGDLRKTVLDRQRKGEDEKQWLIDILMRDAQDPGVKDDDGIEVKSEGGVRVTGLKRKKDEDE